MTKEKHNKNTLINLESIKNYLISKYGELQPQWNTVIELLGDNLDLYYKCKITVDINGIYDARTGKKNPLLSTMKDLQATILKQIQHLGISPYAASKIKDEKDDDTDEFIDSLIK